MLTFSDEQRERRTVQLNAQGMKYTEPGMITYKFNDGFNKFIRLTTDEEFADIMNQVAGALEIKTLEEIPFSDAEIIVNENKRLKEALKDHQYRLVEAEAKRDYLQTLLDTMDKPEEETIRLKTERDLYKSQFESLLERVIEKAV